MKYPVAAAAALALLCACDSRPSVPAFDVGDPSPDAAGNTAPSSTTAALQSAAASSLPLDDPRDFEDARRGLVASDPKLVIPWLPSVISAINSRRAACIWWSCPPRTKRASIRNSCRGGQPA